MEESLREVSVRKYLVNLGMEQGMESYKEVSNAYYKNRIDREEMILKELDGDINKIFTASKELKERYNDLSYKIVDVETKALEWYKKNKARLEMEELKFMNPGVDFGSGWYQNRKGELFHYDGVVWDVVPAESIKDLEYLG